jgi:hypothetical protein
MILNCFNGNGGLPVTVPEWLVYVWNLGGNAELLTTALPCLSDVAQQYTEQQKKSNKTPTPLPRLSFFYEGSTVSSKSINQFLRL